MSDVNLPNVSICGSTMENQRSQHYVVRGPYSRISLLRQTATHFLYVTRSAPARRAPGLEAMKSMKALPGGGSQAARNPGRSDAIYGTAVKTSLSLGCDQCGQETGLSCLPCKSMSGAASDPAQSAPCKCPSMPAPSRISRSRETT